MKMYGKVEVLDLSEFNKTTTHREALQSSNINSMKSSSVSSNNCMANSYFIDPKQPGICLIIDQKQFFLECDENFKYLLPNPKSLDPRIGTEVDKQRLVKTFENLNYAMVVKDNLSHREMIEVIESTVKSVNSHSSLIICVLSHGFEGHVYGVNSVPVKVEDIKEIMCTKNKRNLQGKPKVLILQSCQGTKWLEADDSDDEQNYAMDGPAPNTCDLLVFYATIPGFGAIRHKQRGSWFIQILCDKIDDKENFNSHFDDICTLVQGEITAKRWITTTSNRTMVPMKTSTFTKFFYLPRR